jgi:hypothetical protein
MEGADFFSFLGPTGEKKEKHDDTAVKTRQLNTPNNQVSVIFPEADRRVTDIY